MSYILSIFIVKLGIVLNAINEPKGLNPPSGVTMGAFIKPLNYYTTIQANSYKVGYNMLTGELYYYG